MFQNNPLLAQLKEKLHQETPRIEGIVKANEKGYGFLELDNKKSYFIPTPRMKKLLHGDRVKGTIQQYDGKEQFDPEEIIDSALDRFIGRVSFENNNLVIYPENSQIKNTIRCKVSKNITTKLEAGDWIVATLAKRTTLANFNNFFAEIIEFVAKHDDAFSPWLRALTRYELEKETIDCPEVSLLENEDVNRHDLTHLPFFTIDSENTQDIDDAIYIEKKDNQFTLTVAIADPTAYVAENSILDDIARKREFTVYLPNFTVSMLPDNITTDLCSLQPNQKRPAVVCRLQLDENGQIIHQPEFLTAWISSKAKLAYDAVSDYLEGILEWSPVVDEVKKQTYLLAELANSRILWRKQNALVSKDLNDYRFILDEKWQLIEVKKEQRRIANRMIEEAMIVVNQALADELSKKAHFGIFNAHSGFEPKYLDMIVKILKENQIDEFDKESLTTFDGYCQLRNRIADNPFLEARLLRYQSPADFSFEPKPHYGLGFQLYTTWTSPLRKYSDMVNHRLIKSFINQKPFSKPDDALLKMIAERRKSIRYAERDLADYLYVQYLSQRIDEKFNAEIIDINKGGARVRLTDLGAIAFMPVSLIHPIRQEVEMVPDEGLLKIQETTQFKLADKLEVTISEVKIDNLSIIVKRYQSE